MSWPNWQKSFWIFPFCFFSLRVQDKKEEVRRQAGGQQLGRAYVSKIRHARPMLKGFTVYVQCKWSWRRCIWLADGVAEFGGPTQLIIKYHRDEYTLHQKQPGAGLSLTFHASCDLGKASSLYYGVPRHESSRHQATSSKQFYLIDEKRFFPPQKC